MKTNTVIVVDDEPDLAEIIKYICEPFDIHVHAVEGGKNFSDLLKTVVPDFVFIDIFMPEMDGFEIVKWLELNASTYPIVLVSGDKDYLKIAESLAIGGGLNVVSTLGKPIDLTSLEELIKNLANPKE